MDIVERFQLKEKFKHMAPVRIIVISFALVVVIGAILLSLPISSKGAPIPFIDAAFIATSATCVTGLTLFDVFHTFTWFGQGIIILLIQVGGLGLATFATAFTLLLRKKLGFKNLMILGESSGSGSLALVSLLKMIMGLTFSCEAIGALLLMIRFVPAYGGLGVWSSIFVSISAFCNAGFDVLGFVPNNTSLTAFYGDPLVCMTIAGLIFVGGLGFIVVKDVYTNKLLSRFKNKRANKLEFHSQVCIRVSIALVIAGAIGFFLFEYSNTMEGMNLFEKINTSIFQSVNTRTAGFASVNIGAENDITKMLTIILMFIGGCPGSTAGGIKVTTFIVLASTVMCTFKGKDDTVFLNHRFDKKIVYKSLSIVTSSILLIIIDLGLILFFNKPGPALDILLEAVSAFGTVGLSAGITPELNVLGKILIMLTMFIGRVGPASLGIAIMTRSKKSGESILPEGRMLIG